jgi:uncharacterized protein YkwD
MLGRSSPRLVSTGAGSAVFDIVLKDVAVGSAPGNDLVIEDRTVSRRHAAITLNDNRVRLTDLGATNGTSVNGRRILAEVDLNDGDEVCFGAAAYRFIAAAPVARTGSRAIALIAVCVVIFAVGFAITLFAVNLGRLQEAAEISPAPAVAAHDSSSAAASSGALPASTAKIWHKTRVSSSTPAPSSQMPSRASSSTSSRLWLDSLNRYRKSAGLTPVTENPRFSRGDYLHARYVAKNFGKRIAVHNNLGIEMHIEDPSKPWYSVEGAAAGRASDVDEMWDPRGTAPLSWAIDNWMQSPFHRIPILNPHLHSVGYGYDCEGGVCIAALNVNGDVDPVLFAPAPFAKPIIYPPKGASIDINSFDGEWPDPLTSCPGYSLPAGYPITIQFGSMVNPGVTSVSLKRTEPAPAEIQTCAFDGNTYRNPDPGTQKMVRYQLTNFGAIVIMPRAPLSRGAYSVTVIAGGRDYSWSFSVAR